MPRSNASNERLQRIALSAWATVGVALVVGGAFWIIGQLMAALVPFIMAAIVILLLRVPVARIEEMGLKRGWAVGLCYVVVLAVLGIAGAFVIPALIQQLVQFVKAFPEYYDLALRWWTDVQGSVDTMVVPEWVQGALDQLSTTISSQSGAWGSRLASGVLSAGSATVTFLFNSALALIVAFWVLKDMPKMRDEIMVLVGDRRREEAEFLIETVLRVLGGYIRGQFIVSSCTGLIVYIGLAFLHVPYALILGIIAGVLNVVPYVGAWLGGLIAAIVAAFIGPWTALGAIIVAFVAQQITDLFISPRVISSQVDLHPALVIFSLLTGGSLLGVWGVLIAIPTAAVAKGLFVYYYERHTRRPIGSEDGALFKTRRTAEPDVCADAPATAEAPATEETNE